MSAALTLATRAVHGPLLLWMAFIGVHLWLGILNLFGPGNALGDVSSVYSFWIERFVSAGTVVGIDTVWVYPIVAWVPMVAASVFGMAVYSSTWITMVMLLDVVAFGVLTTWGRSRQNHATAWWWIAFLALLGPIALGRIDSTTVPLAIIGLVLLSRHPRIAAVVLTLATWIKVWPAALLLAIVIATKARMRVVIAAVATSLAIVAVAVALGSGANVFSFITQQTGRGLQVEAPISTPFLWMVAAGHDGSLVYYDTAILTFQVRGDGTALAAALMTPLLALAAAAIAAIGVLAVRRGATATELLAPLALALVSAFIVFNKVGSPQFESWLAVPIMLGLVVSARGGRSFRVPATIGLVVAALTQLIYPYLYGWLLAMHPLMLLAITCRNLLLIALLAWAVGEVVRRARPHSVHDEEHEFDPAARRPTLWPLSREQHP